jgi:hypothetical protein
MLTLQKRSLLQSASLVALNVGLGIDAGYYAVL